LIDGVAKNMAEDFFKRFEAELEKRYPPVQEPSAKEAAQASKQSAGVPAWMWAAGAAVVAAVVFMVAR
jgi:type VI protein secretion system component VasF